MTRVTRIEAVRNASQYYGEYHEHVFGDLAMKYAAQADRMEALLEGCVLIFKDENLPKTAEAVVEALNTMKA